MYTEQYKRDGVLLTNAFGGSYPETFTHPLHEYRALTDAVGMIDLAHWGALRLTGEDRVTYLNSQVTGNVAALEPGHACHAALTTVKGKLISELFVLRRESELLVLIAQGDLAETVSTLEKYIIADDVTLTDVSGDVSVVAVEGPKSRELVWRIFPEGPLPMDALAFGDAEYQGMPVTVLRHTVTGDRGFLMILEGESTRLVRNYLVQAGVGMHLELVGRAAWNMRRVENGLPWWGLDITDNFPKECRLDDVVSYDKGCFRGQETLARMHYRGHPNWLLVGLAPVAGSHVPASLTPPEIITAEAPPVPGTVSTAGPPDAAAALPMFSENAALVRDHLSALDVSRFAGAELFTPDDREKAVGRLTSPVFSPALGTFLSLGYVRHKLAEPGTEFEMVVGDETAMLEVVATPAEASS